MAITKAADLTLAKNETATEFVAAMLWQLLTKAVGSTPLEDSALRMSKNHVRELVELHNLDQALVAEPKTARPHPLPDPVADEFVASLSNGQH